MHICVCAHACMLTPVPVLVPCVCRLPGKPKEGFRSPRVGVASSYMSCLTCMPGIKRVFSGKAACTLNLWDVSPAESHSYYCPWLIAPDQSNPVMEQGVWIQPLMFPFSFHTDMFQLRPSKWSYNPSNWGEILSTTKSIPFPQIGVKGSLMQKVSKSWTLKLQQAGGSLGSLLSSSCLICYFSGLSSGKGLY